MTRKKVSPPIKSKVSPATKENSRRPRQGGVRERILTLISAGSITYSKLLSKGQFTPSNLFMHLKKLTGEGLIERSKQGRGAGYRLKSMTASSTVLKSELIAGSGPVNVSRPATMAAAGKSNALDEALDEVLRRLAPVDDLKNKLRVLERLARGTPGPVADVLKRVMNDLARLPR